MKGLIVFWFFFFKYTGFKTQRFFYSKKKKKKLFHEPVIQCHEKPTTTTQSLSLVISFMKPRIDQYDYWPVGPLTNALLNWQASSTQLSIFFLLGIVIFFNCSIVQNYQDSLIILKAFLKNFSFFRLSFSFFLQWPLWITLFRN